MPFFIKNNRQLFDNHGDNDDNINNNNNNINNSNDNDDINSEIIF